MSSLTITIVFFLSDEQDYLGFTVVHMLFNKLSKIFPYCAFLALASDAVFPVASRPVTPLVASRYIDVIMSAIKAIAAVHTPLQICTLTDPKGARGKAKIRSI